MEKKAKKLTSLLLIVSLLVGMAGIMLAEESFAKAKKIHLKKTRVTLKAKKTYQQKLIDKNGKTIKATKVKWKSAKRKVARISKTGRIKALRAGKTRMTAKYKGKTYKFTVKVKKVAKRKVTKRRRSSSSSNPTSYDYNDTSNSFNDTSIAFDVPSLTLIEGESKTVTVTPDLGYGMTYDISNSNVYCTWGERDGSSASLTITGSKAGSSVVTVYDKTNNKVTAKLPVTVIPNINTSITVDKSEVTLYPGQTAQIKVKTDINDKIWFYTASYEATCRLGDWDSATKTRTLTITGKEIGSTVIGLYDMNDSSVSTFVTVNVIPDLKISTPSLPAEFIRYSGNYIKSKCIINSIELRYSGPYDNGNYHVYVSYSGEKTYDTEPNVSSGCYIGYKVYDKDDFVVKTGTIFTEAAAVGEKFKAEQKTVLFSVSPGEYRFELLNYK